MLVLQSYSILPLTNRVITKLISLSLDSHFSLFTFHVFLSLFPSVAKCLHIEQKYVEHQTLPPKEKKTIATREQANKMNVNIE